MDFRDLVKVEKWEEKKKMGEQKKDREREREKGRGKETKLMRELSLMNLSFAYDLTISYFSMKTAVTFSLLDTDFGMGFLF
jgi:hypothetical protein